MSGSSSGVRFLYGTVPGRVLLDLIQKTRAERLFVRLLRSGLSRALVPYYAKTLRIPDSEWRGKDFASCRELFVRKRDDITVDMTPDRLVSPCDGWLSVFPIEEGSSTGMNPEVDGWEEITIGLEL